MRKRIVLGSAVVALLMLVSTQMVFMNIVRSDPIQHTGDANIGELWISELDVSSHLATIDYIGIGHVDATDDWVLWEESGNINAIWSVDIMDRHPEYFVIFRLVVYNVDDKNKEIGNDTFIKTYNANTNYCESGTLSVALEFTPQQMQKYSQTLVCYLGVCVKLNGTTEAVDFSSMAEDRSVVAVDFISPIDIPQFPVYVDQANDEFPSMWSWIDGWDEGDKFDDEGHMLNTQTYFNVGQQSSQSQQQEVEWHLGNITVVRHLYHGEVTFEYGDLVINCSRTNGNWVSVWSYMNYSIDDRPDWNPGVHMRYKLWYENYYEPAMAFAAYKFWKDGDLPTGLFGRFVTGYDRNGDGNISIDGHLWVGGFLFLDHTTLENYRIQIVEGVNNSGGDDEGNYYWEESCAYQNSFEVKVDSISSFGITTVKANICEVLTSGENGESVYTFAGDSDDIRVEFTC